MIGPLTIAPLSATSNLDNNDKTESFAAVGHQLMMLEKTFRAIQLYLPNNDMYHQAFDRLAASLRDFWCEEDEIVLSITSDGFVWHGTSFLNDPDHPENLAWFLYRDGLRAITFSAGCEEQELSRFLQLVLKTRANSQKQLEGEGLHRWRPNAVQDGELEEDLLTLLWPEDFAHIHYEFVELSDEDYAPLEPSGTLVDVGSPEDVQALITDDVQRDSPRASEPSLFANIGDFDATLHFLNPGEIERLKHEIDEEYKRALHTNILAILFDIFETQTYGTPQDEVVEILAGLIPHFLGSRQLEAVAYMLRETREIIVRDAESTPALERLKDVPAAFSTPEVLHPLLQMLDDGHEEPPRDVLSELFGQLQPHAIGIILPWIPRSRNGAVQEALSAAVAPLARAHPRRLIQCLETADTETTVTGLEIIARLQLRTIATEVKAFACHDDVEVRKAAALALASFGTRQSLDTLAQLLLDEDREVRIVAAQNLTSARFRAAYPTVETVITSRLRDTQLFEKRVMFEAFAVLGGGSSVKRLNAILNTKRFLRRRGDPDMRACAAMALGKIGTPSALVALERALSDKEPIVRNAAEKAMQENRS